MQTAAQSMVRRRALFSLMLVLFIDGMGQGIIFPILTATITNPHATLLLHHASQSVRDIWYGILIAVYYLIWFLGSTILGDWSDSVGRKKSLVLCLSLAAISFLLSAVAFQVASLWLLLLSRFLGGLTSGDQAIAQAAVIDLCDPAKKAIYLGLVLLSVTLGLVVGPLLGAFLQDSQLVSWFNIKNPFYFAALIAVINIILLIRYFHETHPLKNNVKLKWTRALHVFAEGFQYRPIRFLLLAYILAQLGWAMFYSFTPAFMTQKYQLAAFNSGWFVALMGAGIGIGLGVLPSLVSQFNYKRLAILGYSCIALGSLVFIITTKVIMLWLIVVPTTAMFGLGVANILPLFSEAVSLERQGWIMGVTGSIVALAGGIDAAILGFLSSININMPYVFAIVSVIIGMLMLANYQHKPFVEKS